jgi:hypothetical protein
MSHDMTELAWLMVSLSRIGARRSGRLMLLYVAPTHGEKDEIVSLLLVAAVPTGPERKCVLLRSPLCLVSNPLTNPIEQGENKEGRYNVSTSFRFAEGILHALKRYKQTNKQTKHSVL